MFTVTEHEQILDVVENHEVARRAAGRQHCRWGRQALQHHMAEYFTGYAAYLYVRNSPGGSGGHGRGEVARRGTCGTPA